MERMKETKINVYEYIQGNFEPYYELTRNENALQKIESTKLENLLLNVFTPRESIKEDAIRKDIVNPAIVERDYENSEINRKIDGLFEHYWQGNLYLENLEGFFDDAAEFIRDYYSMLKNLRYNANNSDIQVYQIQDAEEILNHAKTMQSIRGGEPKQNYIEAVNKQLEGIYKKFEDLNSL